MAALMPAGARRLDRLLRPRSIAVVGGGTWCANVLEQCDKIGFDGVLWPVHPTREAIGGHPAVASLSDLPEPPDAVFIGVNRAVTVDVVRDLAAMGAGGAVCFASGFQEATGELADAGDLHHALLQAAGDMPILGPNCYGMLNMLDGVALWPDQHGAARCGRGVALITQSSNMAINLTMQKRGLPLAYVVTAGNQAQTDLADIGVSLLLDPRVTALGLHIEGISDLARFDALARQAEALGKPVVVLKVGQSEQARAATQSHTASLAGSAAGARALLARLGMAQVEDLETLLSTLHLLHIAGPLRSNRIGSMSCSGGEASLVADTGAAQGLCFPALTSQQHSDLRAALGPRVALANPLDYHTYIWGDLPAITAAFTAMPDPDLAMVLVVLDIPREDRCDARAWTDVIDAAAAAQKARGVPMAIVATVPECMPETWARRIAARGVVPLAGLPAALGAMAAAASVGPPGAAVWHGPAPIGAPTRIDEAAAKASLARYGLPVPRNRTAPTPEAAREAARALGGAVVLKGQGVAHKTEAGAVVVGLQRPGDVETAARAMPADGFVVEEQITGAVAELIIGVTRDPAHGFVLTLGAGGTLTEILRDTVHDILPVTPEDVTDMLGQLRMAPLLSGFRGAPAADTGAIVAAVMAVQRFVQDHQSSLLEAEINPLLCTPTHAIAVDALVILGAEAFDDTTVPKGAPHYD